MRITKDEQKALKNQADRIYVCEKSFKLFFYYYFRKYIKLKSAPFHYDMYNDLQDFKFLMWIMFRESAKTAIARAFVVWCIIYKKKYNIHWIGYELKKSMKNARAIANELQANPFILEDFGQMYYEQKTEEKKSKPKKLEQFVATNGVSFSASSTNVSGRGDLESENRPDLYVFDDIENEKTKKSQVMTSGIINNVEEILGGISAGCQVLFLSNYISKYGSIAHFEANAKKSDRWKIRRQSLISSGKISWPDAFVLTAEEERIHNDEVERSKHVKSVENLKIDLGGTAKFNQEMLLIPRGAENAIVREEWFAEGKNRYSKNNLSYDEKHKKFWYQDGEKKYLCDAFTAIDPAVSKKESSDDRAICTILTFIRNHLGNKQQMYLVFREIAGIWGLEEFSGKLKSEIVICQSNIVGCESNGVQEVFRHIFAMHGIYTVALQPDGDKVRRMNQNAGEMEFGKVLFPDDGGCENLLHECFEFTGEEGMPDNRVDAFNYAMMLSKKHITEYSEQTSDGLMSGGIRNKTL